MLAIRKEAFEYLGKPIKREELKLNLERLSKRRVLNDGEKRSILPEPPKFDKYEDRIRLEVSRKVLFLKSDEIIYFEGDGNYCQTYLENGESIFLTQQLKSASLLLPPPNYFSVLIKAIESIFRKLKSTTESNITYCSVIISKSQCPEDSGVIL